MNGPVSRVPALPESEWTDAHREVASSFASDGPVAPLLARLLRAPGMVEAVMPMTRYVMSASTLSATHRVLLGLRTAWLDHCETVWAMQAAGAVGLELDVTGIFFGGADHDPLIRSLLRLADEMVLSASVSSATWTDLASGHDVTWLMDAVETVAHVSFLSCMANSFGVPAQDFGVAGQIPAWPEGHAPPSSRRSNPPLTEARVDPVEGDQIAVRRTLARHSVMDTARRPRADYVMSASPLSPHDRETLILRIGWDCRSEYEWATHTGHVGRARDHGVDPLLVIAGPTAPGVDEHDALLMQVSDELHRDSAVSDATWVALLQTYDLPVAMSVVFTAASYRSTCMSLNAYGVQLDPGDQGFPASVD